MVPRWRARVHVRVATMRQTKATLKRSWPFLAVLRCELVVAAKRGDKRERQIPTFTASGKARGSGLGIDARKPRAVSRQRRLRLYSTTGPALYGPKRPKHSPSGLGS